MGVVRYVEVSDGNGTTLRAVRIGEKGSQAVLTLAQKGRKTRTLGEFPVAELRTLKGL